MEDLYDPEEKILCPYDSSHHIRRCKMSFHLVKCKKNFGEQNMVPCDFNATHIIPQPELRYHHQICCDRKKIEAPIVASKSKSENKFPIPNINIAAEESWDDINVPTYDPKKYTEKSNVLRHLDVESSAKRRAFRLNERQRLSELSQENNTPQASQSTTVVLPPHPRVRNIPVPENNLNMIEERIRQQQNKTFFQFNSQK